MFVPGTTLKAHNECNVSQELMGVSNVIYDSDFYPAQLQKLK